MTNEQQPSSWVQENDPKINEMMAKRLQEINRKKMDEYSHGEYVPGEDGEAGGILIDNDVVMKEQTANPYLDSIKDYISGQDQQIKDIRSGKNPKEVIMGDLSAEVEAAKGVREDHKNSIEKVKAAFDEYDLSANGLALKGSKEAEDYKKKMEALERNGGPESLMNQKPPMNEEYHQMKPAPAPAPVQEVVPESVEFVVPAEKSDTFISTLSIEDRSKIHKTEKLIINELKELNIPTATRTIESLDEYRRVAPRKIYGDVRECVLPNSGYVATVKGCGALAMATVIPDDDATPAANISKRYQFCYDNLVSTSIGQLSLQEFISRTSTHDLTILLYNILIASEPEESSISLTCGNPSCRKNYEIKYNLTALLDTGAIPDEMNKAISEILAARNFKDKALDIHKSSPVMTSKYVQFITPEKEIIFECKSPNGVTYIERTETFKQISDRYYPLIAQILFYIPKILVTFKMAGEDKKNTYAIKDASVIADTITDLDDTSMRALFQLIGDGVGAEEFGSVNFRFPGKYTCPHCGKEDTDIPCEVSQLIFFRLQRATAVQ